ncbi:hypothetical protein ACEWY4_002025 [Coilia grayii]|uniref:SEFIR domain-containing protein n=1 Tax=Coilia grayii TaxID=363190 RepID=A0ABD1KUM3_9TELE
MRNKGQLWSFKSDQVVVLPEEQYHVAVANLPKPNYGHSSDNVDTTVRVQGCTDPKMLRTKICLDRGYQWQPNITATRSEGPGPQGSLTLGFVPGQNSDHYRVTLQCGKKKEARDVLKMNNTVPQTAVYDLEKFPWHCCKFDVQIQPFFQSCSNDCPRRKQSFNICPVAPTEPPPPKKENPLTFVAIIAGLLFTCAIACCSAWVYLRYRTGQKGKELPYRPPSPPSHPPIKPRTVLIIYSRDHPLYTEIVLKLCAFLQAKCATEVAVDLLDSAWLGTVGRLPWLEQQRRRIDKVLILCSRGVHAKWGAMCGQRPVTLREDVRSPNDDMTTAALNLIAPDLQRAASLGKYLVAYFEDVSSERDVPSLFSIAVKYRLMKHFEELFFRIQDVEKYQPDRVNSIKGIGLDDYFKCPSGQALRDAIEAFRAYQLDHPDWFEKECVSSEEQVNVELEPLIPMSAIPPMLECLPLLNEGPSMLMHEVDINPDEGPAQRVHELIPEINRTDAGPSVQELDLRNQPGNQPVYLLEPDVQPLGTENAFSISQVAFHREPHLRAKPVLQEACELAEPFRNEEVLSPSSVSVSMSTTYNKPSLQALQQLLALQQCLTPLDVPVPHQLRAQPSPLPPQGSPSQQQQQQQPVELAEDEREYEEEGEAAEEEGQGERERAVVAAVENFREGDMVAKEEEEEEEGVMMVGVGLNFVEEDSEKRRSRGSDQGYGSRETPTIEPSAAPSSLMALAALQQSLFMANPRMSGYDSGTAPSTDDQQYSTSNDSVFGK